MKTLTILATLLLCAAAVADNITQNHEAGVPYVDRGADAKDNVDAAADITAKIVATGAVNPGVLGTSAITYSVKDAAGNAADPAVRTVRVVDTLPPVITLSGDNPVTLIQGSSIAGVSLGGATAIDSFAGEVLVTRSGVVNTAILGPILITYNAIDPSGNKAVSMIRTVIIVPPRDVTKPVITIRP